jgi:hypothetical protein
MLISLMLASLEADTSPKKNQLIDTKTKLVIIENFGLKRK